MSAAKQVAKSRLHKQLLVATSWQQQIQAREDGTGPIQVGSASRGSDAGGVAQGLQPLLSLPALNVLMASACLAGGLAALLSDLTGRLCSMMAHCARLPAHMPQPCWAETPPPHSQSLAPSAASVRSSAGRLLHMLQGSWCIPSWRAGTCIANMVKLSSTGALPSWATAPGSARTLCSLLAQRFRRRALALLLLCSPVTDMYLLPQHGLCWQQTSAAVLVVLLDCLCLAHGCCKPRNAELSSQLVNQSC